MPDPLRILLHNDETRALARKLAARFPNSSVAQCNSYEGLPTAIADFRPNIVYTVRFGGTPGFPAQALFDNPAIRWVANGGAGTDHFGQWDPSLVTVTNAAGVAADMMAEYVLGGFMHFTLDIPGLQKDKASRIWAARTVRPLKGKTLLIVGLGHTGRAIACRARAFGLHVIGTRAHVQAMENVDEVLPPDRLGEMLPKADFIAISTPLTPETRGLIGQAEFQQMTPGTVIADVSRGGVVDQGALLLAMDQGIISAAVLDVFETEPLPASSPLWDRENLIISPHCSSVFDGWEEASFDLFLDNLERWQQKLPLRNVVDPTRGY